MRQVAGDEDDSPSGAHQRKRELRQTYLRIAVEPHRIVGGGPGFQSTGCVEYQHIQTAQPLADVVDHRLGCPLVGHVRSHSTAGAARRPNRVDDGVRALGLLAVIHHDVPLRICQLSRDLRSDTA